MKPDPPDDPRRPQAASHDPDGTRIGYRSPGVRGEAEPPLEADGRDPAATGRLPALEGLRGLAALAVLTSHVSIATGLSHRLGGPIRALLPRFDVGVAVFFVLSGFLLFRPFVPALLDGTDAPDLRVYLRRRFLRIYPLYWIVLVITILANRLQHLDAEAFPDLPSLGEFVSYASLMHIHRPDTTIGPVSQAWSLGTEVTFYLFLPLFAGLLVRAMRRVGDPARRARLVGWSLLGLFVIATLTRALVALTTEPDDMTHRGMYTTWLPYNLDLFALGMALALVAVWRSRRPATWKWLDHARLSPLSWCGAAVAFVTVSHATGLPPNHFGYSDAQLFTRQLLYAAVAVLLLLPAIFGTRNRGGIRRLLSSRMLLGIGAASYGLYLWHQLVGAEYYHLLDRRVFNTAFWPAWGAIALVSVALALLTHRMVERPLILLGRRRRSGVGDRSQ